MSGESMEEVNTELDKLDSVLEVFIIAVIVIIVIIIITIIILMALSASYSLSSSGALCRRAQGQETCKVRP